LWYGLVVPVGHVDERESLTTGGFALGVGGARRFVTIMIPVAITIMIASMVTTAAISGCFRRPQRRVEAHVSQLVGVVRFGVEPIANVALLGQTWQPHDANGLRLAMQRRGGLGGLLAAGFVVVLEDQDVTAGERVDAVVSPVAARDRGRAVIEG